MSLAWDQSVKPSPISQSLVRTHKFKIDLDTWRRCERKWFKYKTFSCCWLMFKLILKEQVHGTFFSSLVEWPHSLSLSLFQMILYSLKDHLVSQLTDVTSLINHPSEVAAGVRNTEKNQTDISISAFRSKTTEKSLHLFTFSVFTLNVKSWRLYSIFLNQSTCKYHCCITNAW